MVAVIQGQKVVFECGFGTTLIGSQSVPTNTTRFQINSVTKSFTAMAVLRLAELGLISIDEPIGTYVQLPNTSWNKIPIRLYLGMLSGVPDGSTSSGSYEQVVQRVANQQAQFAKGLATEPGSAYLYSDPSYFILGTLLEQVSAQKDFGKFVGAEILQPLQMNNTGLIPFGSGPSWATPYLNGKPAKPRSPISGFSGGGFVSTLQDLEKFAIGLQQKAVLSEESYKAMWTAQQFTCGPQKGQQSPWGLGWGVSSGTGSRPQTIAKNGGGWGWASQITYLPSKGVSVILLQNSKGENLLGLSLKIAAIVYE